MAEGYGRGGVATGGKGGTSVGGAYSFGAKSAGDYLSGTLANEYASSTAALSSHLGVNKSGSNASGRVRAKNRATENIGILRNIAEHNAMGEFMNFAGSMGRGSEAHASQGLVTSEGFTPDAASTGSITSAISRGKGGENQQAALARLMVPVEYRGTSSINYADAANGMLSGQASQQVSPAQATSEKKKQPYTGNEFRPRGGYGSTGTALKPFGSKHVGILNAANPLLPENQEREMLSMTPAQKYFQGVT